MTEQSSFKSGGPSGEPKPDPRDKDRKDEYLGQYKEAADSVSEAEKFATSELPVTHDALPAKGLKSVG